MTQHAPLCFIDTETTGVHPDRKVWEVAMIRRDPGRPEQEASFFVDVDLADADPFGLAVGRFYDRHPAGRWLSNQGGPIDFPRCKDSGNYVDRPTAARLVARFTHGAHLVGAVPNFDSETLAPLLRETGLIPAWHYHLIDVEALAVGFIAHLEKTNIKAALEIDPTLKFQQSKAHPPWSSDELTAILGVEPATEDERHTALGDTRWAMRLFDAIVGGTAATA